MKTTQSDKRKIQPSKKGTKKIFKSVMQSPSDWSYDAPTRCANRFELDAQITITTNTTTTTSSPHHAELEHYATTESGHSAGQMSTGTDTRRHSDNSILNILDTHQFTPRPVRHGAFGDDIEESITFDSIESEMHHSMGNLWRNATPSENASTFRDAANKTHLTAGLVLLCMSGLLDAASLAYVAWINGVGFSIPQILMCQGVVQVLLCFSFGIITAKLVSKVKPSVYRIPRRASSIEFLSLVLPFSMQDNANFAMLCAFNNKRRASKRIIHEHQHNKYGSVNATDTDSYHANAARGSARQMILVIFAFGVFQFTSHFVYFSGYFAVDTVEHFEIAPLFNSLVIALAFLWSYMLYHGAMNVEEAMYTFLMYIGIAVCGYSFITNSDGAGLLLCAANGYLVLSAVMESLAYVVIKYASHVPTFMLVLSSSLLCAILGAVMWRFSNANFVAISSVFELVQITSSGFIQFISAWTFVRGTQLISIGTASFFRTTVLIISSIVIQVFSIDGYRPHVYGILGICLIVLSFVLMLVEKFVNMAQRKM